jgi:hypothetical protein
MTAKPVDAIVFGFASFMIAKCFRFGLTVDIIVSFILTIRLALLGASGVNP